MGIIGSCWCLDHCTRGAGCLFRTKLHGKRLRIRKGLKMINWLIDTFGMDVLDLAEHIVFHSDFRSNHTLRCAEYILSKHRSKGVLAQ